MYTGKQVAVDISFTPSPDVAVLLNVLLDKFENRAKRDHLTRPIKMLFSDLPLPAYFSQTDPSPRLIANEQLSQLEHRNLIQLVWVPGEMGNLLESVTLQTNHEPRNPTLRVAEGMRYAPLYTLLNREPISNTRARLETLLLADQFRFSKGGWRARAIKRTLDQLRAGKSATPFSLSDSTWNIDLLAVLSALSGLKMETPYRVFSVRTFNDSKRFDELKPALVRLARMANPEWKTLSAEDVLREFNLVANPSYIHLAGNWQFTTQTGEILSLSGFAPSLGFPATQIESIQAVAVQAESVLCVENLTSFHEFLRINDSQSMKYAALCLMGNPSPSIRHLLRLIPETIPIYLWSDMDYGGFNILSQLRKCVRPQIHPYLMDCPTFESHIHLSHPLTQADVRNLRRLRTCRELSDVQPIIEHLIQRGLKLEQEAIQT